MKNKEQIAKEKKEWIEKIKKACEPWDSYPYVMHKIKLAGKNLINDVNQLIHYNNMCFGRIVIIAKDITTMKNFYEWVIKTYWDIENKDEDYDEIWEQIQ